MCGLCGRAEGRNGPAEANGKTISAIRFHSRPSVLYRELYYYYYYHSMLCLFMKETILICFYFAVRF